MEYSTIVSVKKEYLPIFLKKNKPPDEGILSQVWKCRDNTFYSVMVTMQENLPACHVNYIIPESKYENQFDSRYS